MPSAREEVADSLVDTCVCAGLNDSYGVSKAKSEANGKSFWMITFAKAGMLDGVIRVYGPNFIHIHWQGALAKAAGLPFVGTEVIKSATLAKRFLIRLANL